MQIFSDVSGRLQSALGKAEKGLQFVKANGAQFRQTSQPAADTARRNQVKNARFRIYVIDTGWNSVARKALRENLDLIREFNDEEEVYFLDRGQSIALLRRHSRLIGHDPIISVHDLQAIHRRRVHHVHGFRLHLGLLRQEDQALRALQMFARFLQMNRSAKDLEKVVRANLHRQGLAGAIEIVGGVGYKHLTEE
ncbi:hypothetical protein [Methylocystis bryophila]|uniref:Uncharacterized protein n=1 Tax=Methylocystis bryophila TaxID=655015 RepID=A0A1W6MQG0_9HYPH|nr:hypothetical protein [Methylocystis bryophila]ARN79834.1 hypothetical protein B1812_00720 [Methylocystis bryophila]BDV39719.1 hypothetical protein DSM21852_29720 [Methylocystis bryophila]